MGARAPGNDACRCRSCGYDMSGLRDLAPCPECGTRPLRRPADQYWPADTPLLLGVLSLLLLVVSCTEGRFNSRSLALVAGVLGLVMGRRTLRLIERGLIAASFEKNARVGIGMSWVGVALGAISLALMIVAMVK